MKKFARFFIFVSFSFVIMLILSVLFRFFVYWFESVQAVPAAPEKSFITSIIRQALPETLFLSVLFSLSYSVRHKIPAVLSILVLFVLSGAFCLGFFMGIERVEALELPLLSGTPLSPANVEMRSGLILSRQDMDIIVLKEDAESAGSSSGFPRVISFPERPLLYQEAPIGRDAVVYGLPLGDRSPWFLQSIIIDLDLTARELNARYNEGLESFFLYGLSLILLLVSLRFLFGISSWPLANLFFGAIVFRAVLSLEVFLIVPEIEYFISSFFSDRVNKSYLQPMVFIILGTLILLYTLLAFLARRKRREDG
ncbi:MAG: hypothetical protein LBI14_00425 [Treponema sp.]|jgi:hypothetical protein|nr:hypothetical protein [Treponema sp.]